MRVEKVEETTTTQHGQDIEFPLHHRWYRRHKVNVADIIIRKEVNESVISTCSLGRARLFPTDLDVGDRSPSMAGQQVSVGPVHGFHGAGCALQQQGSTSAAVSAAIIIVKLLGGRYVCSLLDGNTRSPSSERLQVPSRRPPGRCILAMRSARTTF